MPRITRFFIRSALVCVVLGLLLSVLVVAREALSLPALFGFLQPAALHLLVVGFLTQMVFGVALWMFPRAKGRPSETGVTGWMVFACLQAGLVLRVVAEPIADANWPPSPGVAGALVASALLQWMASAGFVLLAWPRVRGK